MQRTRSKPHGGLRPHRHSHCQVHRCEQNISEHFVTRSQRRQLVRQCIYEDMNHPGRLVREIKAIITSQTGVAGPKSLQRVVRENVAIFERLRADGATWDQIANLLRAHGLRSRHNRVVGGDVLRVLVSRAVAGPLIPSALNHVAPEKKQQNSNCFAKSSAKPAVVTARPDLGAIIQRAEKLRRES